MIRRLFLAGAFVAVALGVAPAAHAGPDAASSTNSTTGQIDPIVAVVEGTVVGVLDLVGHDPGGNSRHVCVINDDLDFYRCVFVPLP